MEGDEGARTSTTQRTRLWAAGDTAAPIAVRPAVLHLVALVAYVLAVLGGQVTSAGGGVALVWPAAGVAATWFVVTVGVQRWVAAALLAAAACAAHLANGSSGGEAVVHAAGDVLLAGVFASALRRGCSDLWGVGGDRGADERGRMGCIVVAALGAGGSSAVAVGLGLGLTGAEPDLERVLSLGLTDASSVAAVFLLVHLAAHRVSRSGVGDGYRAGTSGRAWVVVTAGTLVVYGTVFSQQTFPMPFVVLLWIVWVGLRGDALLAVAQVVLGGMVAVAMHSAGLGPAQLLDDSAHQATTIQAFLASSLVAGLFVASTRGALDELAHRLRAAEAEAAGQAAVLEAAFESMSEAVSVLSADGRVLRSNRGAREVAAMIGAQMRLGGTPMTTLDGAPLPPDRTPARRALAGEVVDIDVVVKDLDGTPRTYHVHATPIEHHVDQGMEARAVAVFRDVTRERAVVEDLEAFAATVAHDLRGPLSGVRGWAELVLQLLARPGTLSLGGAEGLATSGGVDPGAMLAEAVERIRTGTERMDGLIGDLLVHATSRAGALEVAPVDLAGLVHSVVTDRALEGTVRVGALPEVRGDAVLLRHLLDNLVGNAVAYARPGVPAEVDVTGERFTAEDGGTQVLLRVTDNGRGVPHDLRERVFQRFERVPGTGVEGTGLGLSICRTIAERHGGTIRIVDGPGGEGSTFEVRLPDLPVTGDAARADEPSPAADIGGTSIRPR